jgi:hypothetical protein
METPNNNAMGTNGAPRPSQENNGLEAALAQVLNRHLAKGNPQFRARLLNQMVQLARHGNFAETFIRTTPEGTDMVNFARLWEYVLVQADRQTRGYVAKTGRHEFEQTRKDFEDAVDFMVNKLKSAAQRHKLDLAGTNFISRVAQRYGIADKVRKGGGAPARLSTPNGEEGASSEPKAVTSKAAKASAGKAAEPVTESLDDVMAKPRRAAKTPTAPLAEIDDL